MVCGEEYMYDFNCKTGEADKITMCKCDIKAKKTKEELKRYKKGFQILEKYFENIPEEERDEVDKQLNKLKL